jgi:hypothetical protein
MNNSFKDLRFEEISINPVHEEDRWKPVPPPGGEDDTELYLLRVRRPSLHAFIMAVALERIGVFEYVIPKSARKRIQRTKGVLVSLFSVFLFAAVFLSFRSNSSLIVSLVVTALCSWSLVNTLRTTNRFFTNILDGLDSVQRQSRDIPQIPIYVIDELETPGYLIHDIDDRTTYVRQWMVYGWPRDWRGIGYLETYHEMPWAMFRPSTHQNNIDYTRWDHRDHFEWHVMFAIEFRLLLIKARQLLVRLNLFGLYVLFAWFCLRQETCHNYAHFHLKEHWRAIHRRAKRKALREQLAQNANTESQTDDSCFARIISHSTSIN